MLDDLHARAGRDQRRRRRDIESMPDIAAGPAGIQDDADVVTDYRDDFLAHDRRGADQFLNRCPLGGQPNEQPADLRLRRLPRHDVQKRLPCFFARKVLAPTKLQQNLSKWSGGH
jgi:hypothetical protein